ncbi:hypothetical protein ACTVJH_05565 [Desulfoplanes sp. PS50]|jgi:hypothetical protein
MQGNQKKELYLMESFANKSPEILTAVTILESIDESQRTRAVEMLRQYVQDIRNEQKWDKILREHPQPMLDLAAQALDEHTQGKTKEM